MNRKKFTEDYYHPLDSVQVIASSSLTDRHIKRDPILGNTPRQSGLNRAKQSKKKVKKLKKKKLNDLELNSIERELLARRNRLCRNRKSAKSPKTSPLIEELWKTFRFF